MVTHNSLPSLFVAFCLFTFFLLSSCAGNDGRFRLEAQFKNINQGEFFIYNPDTGEKDTVAVVDGRFTYERSLKDTLTLVVLFPNYSEMPVFALPGATVVMKGDASHLRDTEISGTDDNEQMTAFRLKTNEMTPPQTVAEAERFVAQQPKSLASVYVLRRYILQSTVPDYAKAYELCGKMRKAQPTNQQVARLYTLLDALRTFTTEGKLPEFTAVSTKGDTITNQWLKGDANVILAWAMWSFDAQSMMRTLRKIERENKGSNRLKVLPISLDASISEERTFLESDSIEWPVVCDSMLWQTPVLAQLGMSTVPSNIVADKDGNIVARNLNSAELKEKIESLLKKDK